MIEEGLDHSITCVVQLFYLHRCLGIHVYCLAVLWRPRAPSKVVHGVRAWIEEARNGWVVETPRQSQIRFGRLKLSSTFSWP